MGIFRVTKKTIGRPQGFQYPIGLSFGVTGETGVETDNVATNTTGGTKTVDVTNSFAVHTYTTSGTFDPSFTDSRVSCCRGGRAVIWWW